MSENEVRLPLRTIVTVGTLVVALVAYAVRIETAVASHEGRLEKVEVAQERIEDSNHRIEKILCAMCTHLMPTNKCPACD